MKKKKNKEITGEIDGIKYSIDESIVNTMQEVHNIDALKEIEDALRKFKEVERTKNAS